MAGPYQNATRLGSASLGRIGHSSPCRMAGWHVGEQIVAGSVAGGRRDGDVGFIVVDLQRQRDAAATAPPSVTRPEMPAAPGASARPGRMAG